MHKLMDSWGNIVTRNVINIVFVMFSKLDVECRGGGNVWNAERTRWLVYSLARATNSSWLVRPRSCAGFRHLMNFPIQ